MVRELGLDVCEAMPGVESTTISKSASQARTGGDRAHCRWNLTGNRLTCHVEGVLSPRLAKPTMHLLLVERGWGRNDSVNPFPSWTPRFVFKANIFQKVQSALFSSVNCEPEQEAQKRHIHVECERRSDWWKAP